MTRFLLLVLLLAGCSNPPIKPDGANCQWYGVDPDQPLAPLGCPVDGDGMPVVITVTVDELKGLCGNEGFWDPWSWGCTTPDGKAYAADNEQTRRHEQCHCILGPEHVATPLRRTGGGYRVK